MKYYETESRIPNTGRWTEEEHESFMIAMDLYGRKWKPAARFIGTRNSTQVRSHAQKYYLNLGNVQRRKRRYGEMTGIEYKQEKIGAGEEIIVGSKEEDRVSTGIQTCEDTRIEKTDAETQCDHISEHSSCCLYTWYQVYVYN